MIKSVNKQKSLNPVIYNLFQVLLKHLKGYKSYELASTIYDVQERATLFELSIIIKISHRVCNAPIPNTAHESPESSRINNVKIRGELYIFQPTRDVLRFSNETGKLQTFVGSGWIRPELPRYYDVQ